MNFLYSKCMLYRVWEDMCFSLFWTPTNIIRGRGSNDPNFLFHLVKLGRNKVAYRICSVASNCLKSFCLWVKVASSSWVKIRLQAENQLPSLPGSVLKVCVVGWCLSSGITCCKQNFLMSEIMLKFVQPPKFWIEENSSLKIWFMTTANVNNTLCWNCFG